MNRIMKRANKGYNRRDELEKAVLGMSCNLKGPFGALLDVTKCSPYACLRSRAYIVVKLSRTVSKS